MNIKPRNTFLFGLIIGISFSGCTSDPNSMTPEERYASDSMFNNHLSNFRLKVDSICASQKDSIYQFAVDSIKKESMAEIEMLLMK